MSWRKPPQSQDEANARVKEAVARGYELSDVDYRATRWFVLSLFLSIGVVIIIIGLLYGAMLPERVTSKAKSRIWVGQPVPPVEIPHMELDYGFELKRVRERERALLETYSYIDRKQGIIRIPIERAMDLLIEREKSI